MTTRVDDWPDLAQQLRAGWVLRSEITARTELPRGISAMLKRSARECGEVVQRRNKGRADQVLYLLRPAAQGEDAGTLWDLAQAQA